MAYQRWNVPITIESRQIGKYVTINSTERAAHYMQEEWPKEENGEVFKAAQQALLDAYKEKARLIMRAAPL